MGLRIDNDTLRYPDVAIYRDPRDLDRDDADTLEFRYPKIVCEVLSPTTTATDRGRKVVEYKSIDSLAAIVLIDPLAKRVEIHERREPDEWLHRILPPESGLLLTDPAVSLTHAEIFDA